MKYVSSFIHVPGQNGYTVAIDAAKIDNITGKDLEVKVYTSGSTDYVTVRMEKQKFIDIVEDKRRELWEAQNAITQLQLKLLGQIVENTTEYGTVTADPVQTIDDARRSHLDEIPKVNNRISSYDPNKA